MTNIKFNLFVVFAALAALLAFAPGCDTAPAEQATCTNAHAPAGAWHATTPSGDYALTLAADGSCRYAGTKSDGKAIGYACTWKASGSQITFVSTDGSQENDSYWLIDGGAGLQIGNTTWQAVCAHPAPAFVGIWTSTATDAQIELRVDGVYTSDQGQVGRWFVEGPALVVLTPEQVRVFAWELVDGDVLRLVEGTSSATYRRVGP